MDEKRDEPRQQRSVGQRYTAEERAVVLADVPKLGCKPAAAKHGVPAPNVFRWAKAAGITKASSNDETSAAPASPPAPPPSPPAPAVVITPSKRVQPSPKAAAPGKAVAPPWTGNKSPGATEKVAATPAAKSKTVARSYTPSERAEILEYAAEKSVTESATKFNVSRFSIYDWQRKVGAAAKGEGPSPTSGAGVKEIEARRDKEILDEWSRHPGLGPSHIRNQLRRKSVKVSVHTARRVMEDAGCLREYAPGAPVGNSGCSTNVRSSGSAGSFQELLGELAGASRLREAASFWRVASRGGSWGRLSFRR